MSMYKVLIVEDSRIARENVENIVSGSEGFELVTSIENAANAELVMLGKQVDLILMDVCTSDNESGLDAATRIKMKHPDTKIIIMTSMPEYSFIDKAKDAGCESFWYKEYDSVGLEDIMIRTMKGESIYPESTPVVQVGDITSDKLTDRELEIIRLLIAGKKQEEICDILNISKNTIKYHIKNILAKTGYSTTLQLVVDVVDKKLILPNFL